MVSLVEKIKGINTKIQKEADFWSDGIYFVLMPFFVVSGFWWGGKWVFNKIFESLFTPILNPETISPEWTIAYDPNTIGSAPSYELFGFPIVAYAFAIFCFLFWYMTAFNKRSE